MILVINRVKEIKKAKEHFMKCREIIDNLVNRLERRFNTKISVPSYATIFMIRDSDKERTLAEYGAKPIVELEILEPDSNVDKSLLILENGLIIMRIYSLFTRKVEYHKVGVLM